LLKAFFIV